MKQLLTAMLIALTAWHGNGTKPVKRNDYEVYGKEALEVICRKYSQVLE